VILVDSSVWVDYLRGSRTLPVGVLDRLLGAEPIVIGDLILTEVLQGCPTDRDFATAKGFFEAFEVIVLGGVDVALQAARNFRELRLQGVTVRKTVDTIIATRCIMSGLRLLHDDRDFDAFERHLGLKCVHE